MTLPDLQIVLTLTLLAIGIIGALYATWRRFRPGAQRASAAFDAILGRAEVTDRRGKVLDPGQPGLVHLQRENATRLTQVEKAIIEFSHMSGLLTEALGRIDTIDTRVKALENTGVRDIVQAAERAATAAVSAEMLRLVNEKDTVDGKSDEPRGEL